VYGIDNSGKKRVMQKFESDSNPNLKQLTYKNQTTVDPSIIGKETLRFSQGVTLDSRLHKREEEKQSLTKAKSSVNRRKQRQSIRQAVKISMPAKQASVINTSKKSSSKKTNAYMIDEAPTITALRKSLFLFLGRRHHQKGNEE